MEKSNGLAVPESSPTWEGLEAFARRQVQRFIQQVLEEEVTALLGRRRSERRAAVDGTSGYRNGYGKPRRLALRSETIQLRRPRVRGLERRFESRVLPLFERRTREVSRLLTELYLQGLAHGDFELALRGLLGEGAPLSASSIARLRGTWQLEYDAWRSRSLADRELVYAWADGIYVRAGLEQDKAVLLVVIGALRDGTKEVLALVPGHRESQVAWAEVPAGSAPPRTRAPPAACRRWAPGDLGGGGGRVARGRPAALLEPQAADRGRKARSPSRWGGPPPDRLASRATSYVEFGRLA